MNPVRFACVIVTYRCNARCVMCNTWQHPSSPGEEIGVDTYVKLPRVPTINVTGGEPFLREDLSKVIGILKEKTDRLVISSNGFLTKRILSVFKEHPDIGIRVSIEGLPEANDKLRGIKNGFDHGIRTLAELANMGIKDIGFGITVSDGNAKDLMELYHLSKMMGLEFATAALHNSYYFHKFDNHYEKPEVAVQEFEKLVVELLNSKKPKDWYRAYFNYGLINFIRGGGRLLPCEMGHESFFVDPFGEILPCNVLNQSMGNLTQQSFEQIWTSTEALAVRDKVSHCDKNCWMVGSVSQQMKKQIWKPTAWIAKRQAENAFKNLWEKKSTRS